MKSANKKWISVTALVLLIAVMLALVIYGFVPLNKAKPEWELFIDTAPVNYDAEENYFFVMRFQDSANLFLSSIFSGVDGSALTDRVISALKKARIPAEKLGSMATAINNFNNENIKNSLDKTEITEEDIIKYMETTTVEYLSSAIHKFFSTSNLTEEEFSKFLYVYLSDNAPSEYKLYLNLLGRENFIAFFSNSIYLINTLGEIKETGGQSISDYALQAVFYQLGSVYTKIVNEIGVDVLENVLCVNWHFENTDGTPNEQANTIYDKISGKLGLIAGILGAVMQQTDVETIGAFRDYHKEQSNEKIKRDKLIYSQILMSKTIKDAMNSLYNAKTGIADFEDLVSTYEDVIKNTIVLNYVNSGGKESDEAIIEQGAKIKTNMATYSGAINYLCEKNYTLAEIAALDANIYEKLEQKAKDMSAMKYSMDYFVASLLNIWVQQQALTLSKQLGE